MTFLADALLDELQFRHPGWVSEVDFSAAETVSTRKRLLGNAATDGSPVLAYHMSATGTVDQSSGSFRLLARESSR
ncbi:MAG: hypothetical protein QOH56_1667 [Pseudonocardiales bacterium]|nr:hypothetical protein [Pseudonocardiales bacterium]